MHVESMGVNKANVLRRINPKNKKETRSVWASVMTAARWGIKLQTAGNSRLINTRGQRIGRGKKKRK